MSEWGGGVQGMPYVLNLLYFEGCVTMVQLCGHHVPSCFFLCGVG